MHMSIKVVWFQWCGIKSGVNVFGMCLFFLGGLQTISLIYATVVADQTSSPVVS